MFPLFLPRNIEHMFILARARYSKHNMVVKIWAFDVLCGEVRTKFCFEGISIYLPSYQPLCRSNSDQYETFHVCTRISTALSSGGCFLSYLAGLTAIWSLIALNNLCWSSFSACQTAHHTHLVHNMLWYINIISFPCDKFQVLHRSY